MPEPAGAFAFYTERWLVVLTGPKASNLEELLGHLTQVSSSCIFYHIHYLYRTRHLELKHEIVKLGRKYRTK
jgi:hypothetical protein